jgi:hypothetical protein
MLQPSRYNSVRTTVNDYDPELNPDIDSELPTPYTVGSQHSGKSMGGWGRYFRFSYADSTRRGQDAAAAAAAELAAQLEAEERARAAAEAANRRASQAGNRGSMTGIPGLDALLGGGTRRASMRAAGGTEIESSALVIGGDQEEPPESMNVVSTIFSDKPITQSSDYYWNIMPHRITMMLVLIFWLGVSPFIFRFVCGSARSEDVDSTGIKWASNLDGVEWFIMMVLWISVIGGIFKLLPVVTGGPATIDAARRCNLDGVASLGCCSPFSSEDDTILLRSLIGRTCTVFHTIASRHSIQGFYMDTILNERRIKGEANRRNVWLAWMQFLHAMVDVSLVMKEEAEAAGKPTPAMEAAKKPPLPVPPRPDIEAKANYRPVYMEGLRSKEGTPGVAGMPIQERRSRPASFHDVGALISATQSLSDERRTQVLSWGADTAPGYTPRPLSSHMSATRQAAIAHNETRQRVLTDATMYAPSLDGASAPPTGGGRPLTQIAETEIESEEDAPRRMTACNVRQSVPFQQHPEAWQDVTDEDIDEAAFRCAGDSHQDDILNARQAFQYSQRVAPFSSKSHKSTRTKRLAGAIHGSAPSGGMMGSPVPRGFSGRFGDESGAVSPANGPLTSADFPITPSPPRNDKTAREKILGAAYLRPHGLPDLDLNMGDLLPMIRLLDAWLNEMKENEWTYNYWDAK